MSTRKLKLSTNTRGKDVRDNVRSRFILKLKTKITTARQDVCWLAVTVDYENDQAIVRGVTSTTRLMIRLLGHYTATHIGVVVVSKCVTGSSFRVFVGIFGVDHRHKVRRANVLVLHRNWAITNPDSSWFSLTSTVYFDCWFLSSIARDNSSSHKQFVSSPCCCSFAAIVMTFWINSCHYLSEKYERWGFGSVSIHDWSPCSQVASNESNWNNEDVGRWEDCCLINWVRSIICDVLWMPCDGVTTFGHQRFRW
jgi:hypothetical protein